MIFYYYYYYYYFYSKVIKCLLIVPFPESSLNEEVGKLFMEDYEGYFKYVKLMTELHAKPKQIKVISEKEVYFLFFSEIFLCFFFYLFLFF